MEMEVRGIVKMGIERRGEERDFFWGNIWDPRELMPTAGSYPATYLFVVSNNCDLQMR